jgi:hypothetical protein
MEANFKPIYGDLFTTATHPRCWRCEAMDWEHVYEVHTPPFAGIDRPWMLFRCRACGAELQVVLRDDRMMFEPVKDKDK